MLVDAVVDTNVWAHADNPNESRQADSIAFLTSLRQGTTLVCVDPGFSLVESENRSQIGHEYLTHLLALPLASSTLAALAGSGRVSFVPTAVPNRVRGIINQVVHDSSDRVFAKVAHNTDSGVLCSHDNTHFPRKARRRLQGAGVVVVSAAEAVTL